MLDVMNHRVVVNALQVFWIFLTLWYELAVFFSSVRHCDWPDSTESSHGENVPSATRVLLVADPQILDHRSYPERGPYLTYLTRLVVDLNLRKNWRAALHKKPDVVVFLGDMMDGGRFNMSDSEYESYYQRFKSIFRLPLDIPTYFMPGNHDIGLRASRSFSPHAHARYISHFGPLNQNISIASHTLVLLDAPSLIEEDNERVNRAKGFEEWTPRQAGPIELVKSIALTKSKNDPLILLSHIPLSRDTFDCGPLREKGTIQPGLGFGYQNTLGKEATRFLLKELRPSVIFSGDDHDYCETLHTSVGGHGSPFREVSIKSLSMAMGIKRPGFQLLALFPQNHANHNMPNRSTSRDVSCTLPDQISIYLSVYVPLLMISLLLVFFSNLFRVRYHGFNPRRKNAHRSLSLSPPPSNLRLRQICDSGDEDLIHDSLNSFSLPRPALAPPKSRIPHRLTYSFVILNQRRQITCPTSFLRIFRFCSTSNELFPRRKYHGLFNGFVRDSRDIAVFPLALFLTISIWISFS